MAVTQSQLKSMFSLKRVLIPVLIGVGFSVYSLIATHFNLSDLSGLHLSVRYLLLAFLLMGVRDLCYIWRLRVLTDKAIGWKDAFQVIMLWEFASSVTPSMVGGSAFAIFFIGAERIKLGKSTAIVMVTALLDELFYILAVAVVLILVGAEIFEVNNAFSVNIIPWFFSGYGFIILLTTIITVGLFVAPLSIKKILMWIFSLPVLRKWKAKAAQTGDDIILSSKELKGKSWKYWTKASLATALSWTARFVVLNALILSANAEIKFHWGDQLMIYAKQLIMWVMLLISPTPGASGIAEFSFSAFFANYFQGDLQHTIAILWRAISYYPYLAIGLIVLPIWLTKIEKKRSHSLPLDK
ncbi:MAG: flippase-like domain-containing protein [Bacteroidales bacterium]|jgi:uncharacterized protein (TIRG00374 family)|nr:flippase-like domain-containing protein [Bacteroidales bacterium]